MWFNIFKFELAYRRKRPATYIYFAVLFFIAFLAVTTDVVQIGGSTGLIKQNSPYVITQMMIIVSAFFLMITSAIMGVAVLRDFEHKTESLMFSTPISKFDYLLGRFLGSYVVTVFVFSGMFLGFLLGEFMPWRDADKLQAFNLMAYVHPFLVFVLPNLFVSGALFFASGAISRKMLVIYTQGMLLFVFYAVALQLASDLENRTLSALLDPFGIRTFGITTEYWSAAERNVNLAPLEGVLLWNRLIWLGVGLLALVVTYFGFSFNVVRSSLFKRKAKADKEFLIEKVTIPTVDPVLNGGTYFQQVRRLSWFYFRDLFKQVPFWAIVIAGIALLLANATSLFEMYGTPVYATSYSVVNLVQNSFTLFFVILIVFYTGELVWKERQVKLNLIFDAAPMPDFVPLLAKFLGLTLASVVLLFLLILTGLFIQLINGYLEIDFGVYFRTMYTEVFALILLYSILGFFVQTVLNQKFLGFAVMILFFILDTALELWGWEHSMLHFAGSSLGSFSEMNRFGHYGEAFNWFNFYWFTFAALLFGLAVVFSVRGADTILKNRLKVGRLRLKPQVVGVLFLTLLTFGISGAFIYYNTVVVNDYANSDDRKEQRAEYEKTLKKYEFLPQPRIVETKINVDIFPYQRDFEAEGYYMLKNKTDQPISQIHIQQSPDQQATLTKLEFSKDAILKEELADFRYMIYDLKEPLAPQNSLKMDFRVVFETEGFEESGSNTNVVFNGTFFNNTDFFPTLGYNSGFELSADDDREDNDLEKKERMMDRDDPNGLSQNLFGNNADRIRFEMTISTANDQIAIAPGYLQKEWEEDGRKHFHYKMDQPMVNFYSIVSARYEVAKDTWNPPADSTGKADSVNLEIYYHAGHDYNLERMFDGMKKSLTYYSENFSPYQYRQMRIMEFPRYASFAQSFANTVPFSEGIGFILNVDESEEAIDVPFYVTAHEMAHQWWGHQVTEAGVKGNAMLSETLSQYSALMVMKQAYSRETMQKFLRYELDSYLRGRSSESKKEQPLVKVESQSYIHYRKGSLAMYALQDYVGEDSVNAALKRYVQDWGYKENSYPTTKDLMKYLRSAAPDSLQYMLTDMFEEITFFENKTESANFEEISESDYLVKLELKTEKFRADSVGNETKIPIRDWVDVGVFAESSTGEDSLIYLQKHRFTEDTKTLEIRVKEEPTRAGVDPLNILIDRHPKDNVKKVEVEE
ncbi:MAG: M1 family aminopeptidase [Bacteroidota bacterium]